MKQKSKSLKQSKVGVLLGGDSSERKISIKSGSAIFDALVRLRFDVVKLDPAKRDFLEKLSEIDVAFIALHGRGGEDGRIQRVLNKHKIPFTGSDVRGMQRSFDKLKSKRILRKHGVLTPGFRVLRRGQKNQILKQPYEGEFFVKPTSEGSSCGIFCISDLNKKSDKIYSALDKYQTLLLEERIRGRELTVGVLGTKALHPVEIVTTRPFYDYKAKYTKGYTRYLDQPKLSKSLVAEMKRIALKVHKVLELRDFSRIDFILSDKNELFVLEANSIPGFTELSLLPMAAKRAGINFDLLCQKILMQAWRRR